MLRRVVWGALCAAAFAGSALAQGQPPVRIGFSIAKSGLFANGAAAETRVYDLWREQVNAKGGLDVGGTRRPVEFVQYDDQSSGANAVKIYEKLITDDKVDLLFAPYGAATTLPLAPLLERYGMPLVANTATSVHIRELKPGNIWFVSSTVHDHVAEQLVKLLQQNHISSVAVIGNTIPPATEIGRFLKDDLAQAKLEVKVSESYPPDITDMTALLSRVKQAKPQGIIELSLFNDSGLYLRQSKELGVDAPFQFVAIGPTVASFRKMFASNTDGIVTLGMWSPEAKQWPLAAPFEASFVQKYHEDPDYLDSVLAEMSCEIMEEAVAKAGLDRAKFREVMATTTFQTIVGDVKFKGVENVTTPTTFLQIQGDKTQIIWPSSIATAPFKPKTMH